MNAVYTVLIFDLIYFFSFSISRTTSTGEAIANAHRLEIGNFEVNNGLDNGWENLRTTQIRLLGTRSFFEIKI